MGDNTKRILRLHTVLERVMADERFNDGRPKGHEIRTLIIASKWATFEGGDKDTVWRRTLTLAGLAGSSAYELRSIYLADLPRWMPPSRGGLFRSCQVPMQRGPRAGEPCGKYPRISGRVTDPETGEWEVRGWCSRHYGEGEAILLAQVGQPAPVRRPLPNVGGLLPSHIRASNWPDVYRAVDSTWEPPSVGIVADDWPVMAKVVGQRLAFTAIDGGDESSGTDAAVPALRLVTT